MAINIKLNSKGYYRKIQKNKTEIFFSSLIIYVLSFSFSLTKQSKATPNAVFHGFWVPIPRRCMGGLICRQPYPYHDGVERLLPGSIKDRKGPPALQDMGIEPLT